MNENPEKVSNCSKCGLFLPLAKGNKSRITGEYLYRSWCKTCERDRKNEWSSKNRERVNQKSREWNRENPDKRKQIHSKFRNTKLSENPDWERNLHRKYRLANTEYYRADVSARRKRVKTATPNWANIKEIIFFYKNCPKGYQVDHIIPLKGKFVCGLHVIENLQYLSASENSKKRNYYEPTDINPT